MAIRIASGVAFLVFASALAVQYNDPDPLIWVLVYGLIATLSIAAIADSYFPRFTAVLAFVYLVAMLCLSPNFMNTSLEAFSSIDMKNLEHELVRETWGLLICFSWAVVLLWRGLRNLNTAETEV